MNPIRCSGATIHGDDLPLWIRRVAMWVPEHGRDAILARHDGAMAERTAMSVTTAEAMAKSGVQAGS